MAAAHSRGIPASALVADVPAAFQGVEEPCRKRKIQRLCTAANLNIHLFCLVPNRSCRRGAYGVAEIVAVPALVDDALQSVLHKIITRMMK
jgi:hypothetical protein